MRYAAETPEDRLADLARTTKTWRFSPFADCVPERLAQLALAERTLEVGGAATLGRCALASTDALPVR